MYIIIIYNNIIDEFIFMSLFNVKCWVFNWIL